MKLGRLKRKTVTLLTAAVLTVTALMPSMSAKAASEDVSTNETVTEAMVFGEGNNQLTVNATLTGTGKNTIVVESGASLTISGNGTITNTQEEGVTLYIENGATCTIEDGVNIEKADSCNGYVIDNNGTLTIEKAKITHRKSDTHSSNVRNLGTLTVDGATITGGVAAIKNDCNNATERGTLTINGGTFEGSVCAVQNWWAATINDGSFNGKKDGCIVNCVYVSDPEVKVVVNGGTFSGTSVFGTQQELAGYSKVAKNEIKGGTFNTSVIEKEEEDSLGSVTISGGEFKPEDADYIIEHSVSEKSVKKLPNGKIALGTADSPTDTGVKTETRPHVHHMVWETVTEATEEKDGEIQYRCSDCGYVEFSQPLSSFAVYNYNVAKQISQAPMNGTVTVNAARRLWVSYSPAVMISLRDRRDVTLVTDYLYKGTKYELTIPAGADLTPLGDLDSLNSDQCFGYLYLGQYFQNAAK